MKSKALLLAVLICVLAGGVFVSLDTPYAGFGSATFVDIPKGAGTRGVATLLADAGVVRYGWQLFLARLLQPNKKLQAGEYYFSKPASVWQVFGRLSRGDIFYYTLTVPEGHNRFDIAASLAKLGVITSEDFLEAARDPSAIRDLAPEATSLEGYLYPDTYRLTRHTTAEDLCRRMTQEFRKGWESLGSAAPVHAAVTLASLIEKETALSSERPLISSVFHNRLELGMPLDCDPTTIYAARLENRYRGALYRSDLESRSRYNTYQHPGLPPGPIASPGLESLRAALQPAETKYLYFVAKPDGSGAHQFSTELEKHQIAVLRYRRANHKADQGSAARRLPRRGTPRADH
jgi:peptidoglycan lytic transglycosylase G